MEGTRRGGRNRLKREDEPGKKKKKTEFFIRLGLGSAEKNKREQGR